MAAFRGWNDAGNAATAAVNVIGGSLDRELIAEIDPEIFFDFQEVRPQIRLVEGQAREIDWPANDFYAVYPPRQDLLLLEGVEPSLRWRTFAEGVVEIARECDAKMVVTLGALLADVPHTRATHVTGFSSSPELSQKLALKPSNYEGPTGIVGVLHGALGEAGIGSASLWATVPHYVAATPNPAAALALVRSFEGLSKMVVEAGDLEAAAERYRVQITKAVAADEEVSAYVEQLEQSADADAEGEDPTPIPTGDVIAKEFQRFLRDQPDA